MSLFLYNTAARAKERFEPITPGEARLYCCGPTVYHYAHIGNLRTYIFEDLLVRALQRNGYTPRHVINITDVGHLTSDGDIGEDKMEKGAARTGQTVWNVASYYTAAFMKDYRALNLTEPSVWCRATDHIPEQIELVQTLEAKGYTYRTTDGIYFDSTKFSSYGDFARLDLENLWGGARVDLGEKKRPTDFALWKFSPLDTQRQMEWESPWGTGFPGWHIECSAMAMHHLGPTLDIHCGGTDHIRVHHTNEIAQSEAATGKQFSRFWLHGEFLRLDGDKMSKSSGEFLTLDSLIKRGYSPLDYRYFALGSHYRNYLSFSFEALDSAKQARQSLMRRLQPLLAQALPYSEQFSAPAREWKQKFDNAINDDLNIPAALGLLHSAIRDEALPAAERGGLALQFDQMIGLRFDSPIEEPQNGAAPAAGISAEEVEALIAERLAARQRKEYGVADDIRHKLSQYVELKDTAEGTQWEWKR